MSSTSSSDCLLPPSAPPPRPATHYSQNISPFPMKNYFELVRFSTKDIGHAPSPSPSAFPPLRDDLVTHWFGCLGTPLACFCQNEERSGVMGTQIAKATRKQKRNTHFMSFKNKIKAAMKELLFVLCRSRLIWTWAGYPNTDLAGHP